MLAHREKIIDAFPIGKASSVEPYGKGRIHQTYRIETESGVYILQKITDTFNQTLPDTERVTEHLIRKGLTTSRIVRTKDNCLSFADGGSFWRLTTFIPGITIENNPSETQIKSGSAYIGFFHTALSDYDEPFAYKIPNYRDTASALIHLKSTDTAYAGTEKHDVCHPLVEDIHKRAEFLSDTIHTLPLRVLHGDLKLNNLRFDTSGTRAIALIDLDTLGRYPLPLEIGDMLRSWCRTPENTIDQNRWSILMTHYRANASFMTHDEWKCIPDGFFEMTLSLAARYCTDAYEESWFAYDQTYPSLFEQNMTRARQCLSLLDNFEGQKEYFLALHN